MGSWWGQLWIWISLVLFVGIGLAMTPLVAFRLNPIRVAAGIAAAPAKKDAPSAGRRIPRSCVASSMRGTRSRSRSSGSRAFS